MGQFKFIVTTQSFMQTANIKCEEKEFSLYIDIGNPTNEQTKLELGR